MALSLEQLYDDSGDVWGPNQELYSTNPQYKQAWDNWFQWHNQYYGGPPRTSRGSSFTRPGNSGNMMVKTLKDFGFDLDTFNQGGTGNPNDPPPTPVPAGQEGEAGLNYGYAKDAMGKEKPGYFMRNTKRLNTTVGKDTFNPSASMYADKPKVGNTPIVNDGGPATTKTNFGFSTPDPYTSLSDLMKTQGYGDQVIQNTIMDLQQNQTFNTQQKGFFN